MAFEINSSSPPAGCEPGGRQYRYILPPATGTDGNGNPVGAVGTPEVELHFARLSAAGWAYYVAFVDENPGVALTSLETWNPYASNGAGAYETYTTAIMHRPTYEETTWGGDYLGVSIRFTGLEP